MVADGPRIDSPRMVTDRSRKELQKGSLPKYEYQDQVKIGVRTAMSRTKSTRKLKPTGGPQSIYKREALAMNLIGKQMLIKNSSRKQLNQVQESSRNKSRGRTSSRKIGQLQTELGSSNQYSDNLKQHFEHQREFVSFQHKATRHLNSIEKNIHNSEIVNKKMTNKIQDVKNQIHIRQLLMAKQAAIARKEISDRNSNTKMLYSKEQYGSESQKEMEYEIIRMQRSYGDRNMSGLKSHKVMTKLNDQKTVMGLIDLHAKNTKSTMIL